MIVTFNKVKRDGALASSRFSSLISKLALPSKSFTTERIIVFFGACQGLGSRGFKPASRLLTVPL